MPRAWTITLLLAVACGGGPAVVESAGASSAVTRDEVPSGSEPEPVATELPDLSTLGPRGYVPCEPTLGEDPRPIPAVSGPVCAEVDREHRCTAKPCDSAERKTYGNRYEACTDRNVVGYWERSCETQGAWASPAPN